MLSVTPNPAVTFGVVVEDPEFVVVEKRSGLVTQPGKGHDTDTLLNGLFARWGHALQNLGAARDFGLVHRLDRGASGLLIVALRPRAHDALRAQFESRTVRKFYWAVCVKAPALESGVVRARLLETEPRRHEQKVSRVHRAGKESVTAWRVLGASPRGALIEARPLTGRLHQVRAHLDHLGATILGDDLYGGPAARHASSRLALHAHRLVFTHPTTGATVDARSPFPKDLRPLLKRLGLARPDLDEASTG